MPRLVVCLGGTQRVVKVLEDDQRTFSPVPAGWHYRLLGNYKFDPRDRDVEFLEECSPLGFYRIFVLSNPYGADIRVDAYGVASSRSVVQFITNAEGDVSGAIIDLSGKPIATELALLIDYNIESGEAKLPAARELKSDEKSINYSAWLNTQAMDYYVRDFYLQQIHTQIQLLRVQSIILQQEESLYNFRKYVSRQAINVKIKKFESKTYKPDHHNSKRFRAEQHADVLLKNLDRMSELKATCAQVTKENNSSTEEAEILQSIKTKELTTKSPAPIAPEDQEAFYTQHEQQFMLDLGKASIESLAQKYKLLFEEVQIKKLLKDLDQIFVQFPRLQKEDLSQELCELLRKCPVDLIVCLQGINYVQHEDSIPIEIKLPLFKALVTTLLLSFKPTDIITNEEILHYFRIHHIDDLIFEHYPLHLQSLSADFLETIANKLAVQKSEPVVVDEKIKAVTTSPKKTKSKAKKRKANAPARASEEDDFDKIIDEFKPLLPEVDINISTNKMTLMKALRVHPVSFKEIKRLATLAGSEWGAKDSAGNTILQLWATRHDLDSDLSFEIFKLIYSPFIKYLKEIKFAQQLSSCGELYYPPIIEFFKNNQGDNFLTTIIQRCKNICNLQRYLALITPDINSGFLLDPATPLIIAKNNTGRNAYILLRDNMERITKLNTGKEALKIFNEIEMDLCLFCNHVIAKVSVLVEPDLIGPDIFNFVNHQPENPEYRYRKLMLKATPADITRAFNLFHDYKRLLGVKIGEHPKYKLFLDVERSDVSLDIVWPEIRIHGEFLLQVLRTKKEKLVSIIDTWFAFEVEWNPLKSMASFLWLFALKKSHDMTVFNDMFEVLDIVIQRLEINKSKVSFLNPSLWGEVVHYVSATLMAINRHENSDFNYSLGKKVLKASMARMGRNYKNLIEKSNILHAVFERLNLADTLTAQDLDVLTTIVDAFNEIDAEAIKYLMSQGNSCCALPYELIKNPAIQQEVLNLFSYKTDKFQLDSMSVSFLSLFSYEFAPKKADERLEHSVPLSTRPAKKSLKSG